MTHPCNNPNLSPIEFLEAVTHDDTFSIALRAKAAKALTLIHTKAPVPPITIHIKDPYSHEYLARFPWLKEFARITLSHHQRPQALQISRRIPILKPFQTIPLPLPPPSSRKSKL